MGYSRRRLPHIHPEGKWLFVTWHLHGSLPHGVYPPPEKTSNGKSFVWIDRYLDMAPTGPRYLALPDIARIVINALYNGVTLNHYDLGAFVIMANHVHALFLPRIHPSRLLQSLKGFTAREANRMLDRTGEPFWQPESYDHCVRDEQEYWRIVRYIENNPVKAGLVSAPELYPWSSAAGMRHQS
jgi:REP element-mobilizing transposase RayT